MIIPVVENNHGEFKEESIMNTFEKKWNHVAVEDCGSYMSKEAKSFVTAFKNMLKRELKDMGIEVVNIKPNHYDLSGMIKINEKYLYINYNIPRWGEPIDFDQSGAVNGVLYRPAKHETDWHGGRNRFCSIRNLPASVRGIFNNTDAWSEVKNNR